MKLIKVFVAFSIGLVNDEVEVNVELIRMNFFKIYLSTCQNKKYQIMNYLEEDKRRTNWGITTTKESLQSQKIYHIVAKINKVLKPRGDYVSMCSLCQNISGLSFTEPIKVRGRKLIFWNIKK